MVHAKRDEMFQLGDHSFDSKVRPRDMDYELFMPHDSCLTTHHQLSACMHGRQMEEKCVARSAQSGNEKVL